MHLCCGQILRCSMRLNLLQRRILCFSGCLRHCRLCGLQTFLRHRCHIFEGKLIMHLCCGQILRCSMRLNLLQRRILCFRLRLRYLRCLFCRLLEEFRLRCLRGLLEEIRHFLLHRFLNLLHGRILCTGLRLRHVLHNLPLVHGSLVYLLLPEVHQLLLLLHRLLQAGHQVRLLLGLLILRGSRLQILLRSLQALLPGLTFLLCSPRLVLQPLRERVNGVCIDTHTHLQRPQKLR